MSLRILAASAFLVASASVVAQFPSLASIPTVEYNPLLFINPQVQKELRLSPTVASKLQTTFMQEAFKILPTLNGESSGKRLTEAERTKRTLAAIGVMEKRLAAMLTPAQKLRMRQLTLQSIGATAVLQPKVASTLGLSNGQKARLATSVSDANEGVAARMRGGMSAERMPELTRLQNEAKAKANRSLLAILTPAQRTKWKAMLGKPFKMSGFLGAPAMSIGG